MLGRVSWRWVLVGAAAGAALAFALLVAAPGWLSPAPPPAASAAPRTCRAPSLRGIAAAAAAASASGSATCRAQPPAPPPAQPTPPPQAPPGAAALGHIVIAVLLVVSAAGALLEVFRDRIKDKAATGGEESDDGRPGRRCSLADLTVSRHARRESVQLHQQLQLQPPEPVAAAPRPPLRLPVPSSPGKAGPEAAEFELVILQESQFRGR
ncbi:translation initiation factor IF-2-like [Schistocerca gregaria]|uniref:translation initiation factor IF-2-like n=1 Tax=Schistocerca gregaria TaxID=7010 RepID=UPI00211F1094|nr:translation initiation factor IF-2-like [Schistocerca gregaria]